MSFPKKCPVAFQWPVNSSELAESVRLLIIALSQVVQMQTSDPLPGLDCKAVFVEVCYEVNLVYANNLIVVCFFANVRAKTLGSVALILASNRYRKVEET